ncbi:MAG: J domain-containing protein [Thermodesulfobacteriota bacterium]
MFSLRWLKNLLLALHTNYGTFSFSEYLLIINILPYRSHEVFSFFYKRTPGQTPAEDLKAMCIELSREWYNKNKESRCRSLTAIHILNKAQKGTITRNMVEPVARISGATVLKQLKTLNLSLDDVRPNGSKDKIKAAYRKEALKTHPDVGGDGEQFKIVVEAYQELIEWLKHPHFIISRGVPGKWSYDGGSFKWRAPL